MTRKVLVLPVLLAVLGASCAGGEFGPDVQPITVPDDGLPAGDPTSTQPGPAGGGPTTDVPPGVEGPVFVDSTDILYLESFPVQVRLVVRGSLPTPCHEIRWEVEDSGPEVDVRLWSEALPGLVCAQVLEPFEISVPLGESSGKAVFLNGEAIGRLSIGAQPVPGAGSLVGAGWSFGMCGGYCTADLLVEGENVVVTGGGWTSEEPLYVNRGILTEKGRRRIGSELARLVGRPLESVYGCPDCADGGAAYLVLEREGMASRHEMEFGRPPEALAELHGLAMAIIDALESCESDELVTPGDDCQPWQGF